MGEAALSIGANTFQFFTRNPRGGKAKDIDQKDVDAFLEMQNEKKITKVIAHAPYTLNPCAVKERTKAFAYEVIVDDLSRMERIPNNYYNFHPGNHVGQGLDKGIELIADLINRILKPEQTTTILLETMSGKGTEVGSRFEELRAILDQIELQSKVGVCLDTCHVYDAGYDIVNDLENVLSKFDSIIGLQRLLAIHLNDSKNQFMSHKDRHATIGQGTLGLDTFEKIINHKRLTHLPFCLETPNDLEGHSQEIRILRGLYKKQDG